MALDIQGRPTPPSQASLLKASAIAFVGAAFLLVTTVLPAEYGIDPLGTGAALGLLAISKPGNGPPLILPAGGRGLTPVQRGDVAQYAGAYHVDSAEFVIEPYEYMEYKYHLEKGASMIFSWNASEVVTHDFHDEPDADSVKGVKSFDKRDAQSANGGFTAPFTGIHGWYWENKGTHRVTVKVKSAGFYSTAIEFGMNGKRTLRDVKSPN
ncbi:MAG: hypothetical protein J0H61_09510 [Alphaproteobacteria bacterium]|nr:hypothetical protein [Alphaproteobacteria bacterium]